MARDPEVTALVRDTETVTAQMLAAVADLRAVTDDLRTEIARLHAEHLRHALFTEQDYVLDLMEIHRTDPDADLLTALDNF